MHSRVRVRVVWCVWHAMGAHAHACIRARSNVALAERLLEGVEANAVDVQGTAACWRDNVKISIGGAAFLGRECVPRWDGASALGFLCFVGLVEMKCIDFDERKWARCPIRQLRRCS